MEPSPSPANSAIPEEPSYRRDELMALDNFLTTHPSERRLLGYLYEHKDETHTLASLNTGTATAVTLLDLKALVVHKLMEARDSRGRVIPFPIYIQEDSQFRILPSKLDLIEAALQRRKWNEMTPCASNQRGSAMD